MYVGLCRLSTRVSRMRLGIVPHEIRKLCLILFKAATVRLSEFAATEIHGISRTYVGGLPMHERLFRSSSELVVFCIMLRALVCQSWPRGCRNLSYVCQKTAVCISGVDVSMAEMCSMCIGMYRASRHAAPDGLSELAVCMSELTLQSFLSHCDR